MTEKTFEREVLDRLIAIETKLYPFVDKCTDCQNTITAQGKDIVRVEESVKSAHKRIDGVYKTASMLAVAVSGVVTIIMMVIEIVIKTHGG